MSLPKIQSGFNFQIFVLAHKVAEEYQGSLERPSMYTMVSILRGYLLEDSLFVGVQGFRIA
jgi:hypothetical protein